jgi:hypothetical protein
MKNLIWSILILSFFIDIFRRNYLDKNIPKNQNSNKSQAETNNHNIDLNISAKEQEEIEKENNNSPVINPESSNDFDKIKIRIKYCTISFSSQFQDLKNELTKAGNFSKIEVEGEEYPIHPIKKILSKIFGYMQFMIMVLMIGGQWIRPYLSFIPDRVFKFIEEKRMIIGLVNFFLMSKISSTLGSSNEFDVYVNNEIVN